MGLQDKIYGKKDNQEEKVKLYATMFRISPKTLWGVYGTESGFGKNLGPSSAGALGPFQFMPATAKEMHVDVNNWDSSAQGAARYLHQLGADSDPKSGKTVNALNRYNGNGGGTSVTDYVQQVWKNGETFNSDNPINGVKDAVGDAADTITAPLQAAQDVGDAISGGIEWLTDPSSWLRVGKGVLGITFIILGAGGLVYIAVSPAAKAIVGVANPVKKATKSVKAISEVAK